ncbi:MAG: ABC transporter ATP-binding protein [Gemmatimonadaceae bacterium]|nr:ABC transporter ATP-binding protein [Gemmatimonadaceae bacterium]
MTPPAIRVSALVRDFPKVRALDRLTFEVPRGVVFGFLGPNGAGKTTVIRVLLGLLDPTEGSTEVFGLDPRTHGGEVRAQAGALLEHNGVYERLSALQNVDFYARAWRMPRRERQGRIRELLSQFGLWDRRDEPVGGWSRGMKQKLAIARAVLHRPPLVFLDEPTAGLDPVASASLRDDLVKLAQQEGVTIFLTTHNLAEAERLCALVGVIRKGRLLDFGAPHALRAAHGAAVVHVAGSGLDDAMVDALAASAAVAGVERRGDGLAVRIAPGGDVPTIVAWLVTRGVRIEEVRPDRASFEDVFLELVTSDAPAGEGNGTVRPEGRR